jgi:hypothetical protein
LDKQLKKTLVLMRQRKQQRMREHFILHEQGRQIAREAGEQSLDIISSTPDNSIKEPTGCARLHEVRNKLTGRKTMAKERWNRFAGTAAAGGKGL